jgi:DNA-binding response OmpR family regulator
LVAEVSKLSPSRSRPQKLVLVVDPDRVSSMMTARILERMGAAVECVADAAGGLELLQQREVDLVVCEATLPDIPAASFIAMSQRIYAPATLPVLVVTMDLRSPDRVDLLRAGALECLTKPVEAEEFRFRVQRALHERAEAADSFGAVHLGGDLEAFPLTDVLTVLDLARHTGRVEVASSREYGAVELVDGAIRHAQFGTAVGIDALATILRVARGWFRVRRSAATSARTIEGSTTQSILEATVTEANRRRSPSVRARNLDELGVSKSELAPQAPELARLARRLAPLLQDPHKLGELELAPRDVQPREHSAFTITWFGDGPEVISTLWEISAPLGPQILQQLRMPGAALRWRFHGRDRDQLVIRVVELDEPSPAWFHLHSDVVILAAPPTGPLVVDPAIRAYVLTHKLPALVIAQEAESARLFSPAPFSDIAITGYRLAELRGQTRALLASAVRMRTTP